MTDGSAPAPRHRTPVIVWLLPLACAIYAVAAGRDANWDLLNYHYYNVHAWLTGRGHLDLAVGQLQTWFNPLLHLPLYIGMEYLPPRVYAALLGAVQGLNLLLIWSIARAVWPAAQTLPVVGPLLVTIVAGCGAGFLTQLGTSFGDTILSLPILGGLRLILEVGARTSPPHRGTSESAVLIAAAGVLAGIAVGLKPLAGIYAIALACAVASLSGHTRQRLSRLVLLGLGGLVGVVASAGWWYWHVWQLTGNPLFPYYNDIFQSPLYWNERFAFTYFLPKTILEAIFYPWIWLANPTRVSEMRFIALAIPGLATLVVVVCAARMLGLRPQGERRYHAAIPALVSFWVVAYVLWLTQSSVYRFAVVLEMTAPLLIVAMLARWVPTALLRTRIVAVLVPVMLLTWPANFGRYAFDDRFVTLTPIDVAPGTMVLVAGWAPVSYLVPAFPPNTPVVRIQSNMHGFADRPNGLDAEARRRVETHAGPLVVMLAEPEWNIAQPLLDHYHYVVDRPACRSINGALGGGGGAGLLALCPVVIR